MSDVVDRLGRLEEAVFAAAARAEPAADGARIATGARAEAAAVLGAGAADELVVRRFASSALAQLALAGAFDAAAHQALVAGLEAPEQLALDLAAVAHPSIATLPLPVALGGLSALLGVLAGMSELSAWRSDMAGRVARIHEDGASSPTDAARLLARRCLVEGTPVTGAVGLFATPVQAFGAAAAALVWKAKTDDLPRARLLVTQAATTLAAPLQQALTADQNADAHRALVQAPERRLTRLALDLHDGALQDVALVAGELRRLEDDLRPALKGRPEGERVRGTLETLASLIAALDADLREVATGIEGPSALKRPFPDVVEAVVAGFRARTHTLVDLDVSGDLDSITDSQRITLFRVVQESLANVRQHADAHAVTVRVQGLGTHVEAEIVDDGLGFDLAKVVDHAGRSGRLGLVGMVERVRLLGGRCDITSQPGRGTSVRVRIDRYEPLPDRRA